MRPLLDETDMRLPLDEGDPSSPFDETDSNTAADNSTQLSDLQLNTPLYPGAKVTLHIALLLILAFSLCHKISNEALEDLLSLFREILIPPTVLPTSLYMFFKVLNIKKN